MNTYKNNIPSPYKTRERIDPIQEEITKNAASFKLTVVTEQDFETMKLFKNIPGFVAFKTTLSKDNQLLSIGYGSAVLNRLNKFVERTVLFAKNSSLIDAMVRSTKILDALSIMPNQKESDENDLEGRNSQAFFGEDDMPQYASQKQRNFLSKLVQNCDEEDKEEYMSALASPYLSKFQCSELIQKLMPIK
ncbi:MAG: hypothetical protein WCS86_03695 [Candidatus Paceibacterota bacterium]